MRRFLILGLMFVVACVTLQAQAAAAATVPDSVITGDYVEARTASVFAGACHYNGEVVTTGRDAVIAWNIKSGHWQGIDLSGVRAIAVVVADNNLSEDVATRRTEIVFDNSVSEKQMTAFKDLLRSRYGTSFGDIAVAHRAPVTFRHEKGSYHAESTGFAVLTVRAMPSDECCKMPHMVWYAPLLPLTNRKVGYTAKAAYAGGSLGEAWERARENSAFYGSFSL